MASAFGGLLAPAQVNRPPDRDASPTIARSMVVLPNRSAREKLSAHPLQSPATPRQGLADRGLRCALPQIEWEGRGPDPASLTRVAFARPAHAPCKCVDVATMPSRTIPRPTADCLSTLHARWLSSSSA